MNVNKGVLKSMHEMASRAIDSLTSAIQEDGGVPEHAIAALDQIEGLEVMLDTLHYEAEINDQGGDGA